MSVYLVLGIVSKLRISSGFGSKLLLETARQKLGLCLRTAEYLVARSSQCPNGRASTLSRGALGIRIRFGPSHTIHLRPC